VQGPVRLAGVASLGAVGVELLLDGAPVAASPRTRIVYEWDTTTVQNGIHRWAARAYGASGETVSSVTVDVVVGDGQR